MFLFAATARAQDWHATVRDAVRRGNLDLALDQVNARLEAVPDDWEALGWKARITAWKGHWSSAEQLYQNVLQHNPNDSDILLGLCDVMTWKGQPKEAFKFLDRAGAAGADPKEVLIRRARLLAETGQFRKAKLAYQRLLALDPANVQARAALAQNADAHRFELRLGSDADFFSYSDAASSQRISLLTNWSSHWSTEIGGNFTQRFGAYADGVASGVTFKAHHNYLSASAVIANRQEVVASHQLRLDYGHSFSLHNALFRGMDSSFEYRRLWFTQSQVRMYRTTTVLYLPKELTWTVSAGAALSSFENAGSSWTPATVFRFGFPLRRWLQGSVQFADGAENYAYADQIGIISARSYGGGLRLRLTTSQEVWAFGELQTLSKGRRQNSVGTTYVVRF